MKNIDNIKFYKKKIIIHNKGNIMHYINRTNKNFIKFGEVYFSWIKKNKVKGWKFHKKMHMNLTVPVGEIQFTFFDSNLEKNKIINLGEKKFGTLYVPPRIWFSFKNLNKNKDSLLVNFSSILHSKTESLNKKYIEKI